MSFYSSDGVKRAQVQETIRFIRGQDSGPSTNCEKVNLDLRFQRNSNFLTILEPDSAGAAVKGHHLRNRTSVKTFCHTGTVSQVVTFYHSARKSGLSNGPKVGIPLET